MTATTTSTTKLDLLVGLGAPYKSWRDGFVEELR
ncbi:hypothetical protein FHU39_002730 [Flexivirga oryzae]|uniref:Uncharacterized protein n=1 Tax=Flexivirga oryzae TaxID=1794944 RepID=A0A839NDW1_9MICO|nr:hypothetical protein [Flexivirga oryzae]